jgi:MFS family permease
MIYPVLLPYFNNEFGLSLATGGLLVTIIWLSYAFGQVPGGVLADKYGERKMLTVSVVLVIISLVFVLFASTVGVLFAATAAFGLAYSQYPIARITALSDLYPERIGRALGLTMASGDIGQTILPPIASVIAVAAAWQFGLGFVLPFLCLAAVVIWITLDKYDPAGMADSEPTDNGFRYVIGKLREPTLAVMWVIMFLFIFVWQTFSAFYPTYLVEIKGFSTTTAGLIFGLFFAFGVIAKPAAGVAYDKIGIRISLPLILLGSIVGLGALPFVDGTIPILCVTILVSTMLGSGAITQSYLADTIPTEIQGSGLGMIRSSSSMIGASGPVVFGIIAERGYFDQGYLLLAALVATVTLISLLLPKQK